LLVEQPLIDRAEQPAHAVAFEEQRALERGLRHGLEVVGAVEVGGAVEISRADVAQRREEVARDVFRALEHQVLEQVGEAGLALRFVLRADGVPGRDGDDRRLAVSVHEHAQAVGEREALVGNVDFGDELGDGHRLGRLRNNRQRQHRGCQQADEREHETAHNPTLPKSRRSIARSPEATSQEIPRQLQASRN
jgi:hypothetical protein